MKDLEEERYALFCQQADSEQLLAKKRSFKKECLTHCRHIERLSEEHSAEELNVRLSSAALSEETTACEALREEAALFTAAEANVRRQSGLLEEAEERLQQQEEDVRKVLRIYTGEPLQTPPWIEALIREQAASAPMPTPMPLPQYVLPPGPRPMQATGSDAFRHFWRLLPALGRDCLSCRG